MDAIVADGLRATFLGFLGFLLGAAFRSRRPRTSVAAASRLAPPRADAK